MSAQQQQGGDGREVHKSMIDDVERYGAPSNGRFESNPDAKEGTFDENAPKKNASEQTKDTGTTGDTDSKPAGGVNTGGSAQPQTHADIQQGQNDNSMSNSNEPNTGFGGAGAQPSVGADVSDADKAQRTQGGDRPMDDPSDQKKPSTSEGGAPKPLSGGASGGADGGMKPDPGHGTGEGTGERYEKSTGVQAEGGDFDATRPGAGREADRLMEQSGIAHGEGPKVDEKSDKKAFPVDHSGFGGHGSHSNAKGGSTAGTAASTSTGDTTGTAHTDKPVVGSDTGKKSLVEKVKEKVIHH